MATYDRTITGGGTTGHPGAVPRPYIITSPVYDAVDNTSCLLYTSDAADED